MESGRALIARIRTQLLDEKLEASDQSLLFESRLIAEKITGDNFTQLALNEYKLDNRQNSELARIFSERNTGKPLAYVLGSATFRDLELYVDERVLIPRSETEIVVQYAIDALRETESAELAIFDIGTGSGAIALSVAIEVLNAKVYAGDVSSGAIEVARSNSEALGLVESRVKFFESDLFDKFPHELRGEVDMIISNPPYIGLDETDSIESSVLDFEPHQALFSSDNGSHHYSRIIAEAKDWLKKDGLLILEISPRHVEFMQKVKAENTFSSLVVHKDLAGRDRVAIFSK